MTLSPVLRHLFRYLALAYVAILVIVPVALILLRTFAPGIGAFFDSITTPAALSALQLSVLVVAIVVPLNVLFGIPTALVLARNRFRGKSALQAVIDLPFAVSPVVVGVALILLWGSAGLLGFVENNLGFKIIFGFPGIVLASIFVTVPFVIREVEPVLHEIGTDQEEAAATLALLVADRCSRGAEYGAYAVSTLLMTVAVIVLIVQVVLDARRARASKQA